MSSSRRTDRIALVAAFVSCTLGGCMRIYPDPELPDIEVDWYDGDCREGIGDVHLALVGVDTPAFHAEQVVPCSEAKAVFADIARERYRLQGALQGASGEEVGGDQIEIDLRDGLDHRASLYFGGFNSARVAWVFDMDASCSSLAVDTMVLEFSSSLFPEPALFYTSCEQLSYFVSLPDGVYTVVARAVSNMATVAISPPSPDVEVSFEAFADFGTLVLSPCGSSCP